MPREMLGVFAFAGAAISLAWSTGSLYGSLGPSLATNLVGIGDRSTAGLFAAAWQLLAGMSQFACQRQPVSRMLLLGPSTLMVGLLAMAAAAQARVYARNLAASQAVAAVYPRRATAQLN